MHPRVLKSVFLKFRVVSSNHPILRRIIKRLVAQKYFLPKNKLFGVFESAFLKVDVLFGKYPIIQGII